MRIPRTITGSEKESAMTKVKLVLRKREIIRLLSELFRKGWANAKPHDYLPLEAELRTINERLHGKGKAA